MPRSSLIGSRIRERRIHLGMKQARLAEVCGISASYLNLIEHNRRRIGGKLLNALAAALDVTSQSLAEGADDTLIDGLRDAAASLPGSVAETDRAEEFAGRFPGWAALVAALSARVATLERSVETLNDRLTHDPFLSDSLHDILSTVTAIRSASAILSGDEEVEPDWQARFHSNIYEDSQRLTGAAQALVSYLDAGPETGRSVATPQEEVELWLAERGFHVAELEGDAPAEIDALVSAEGALSSAEARALARDWLGRYRRDAEALPLESIGGRLTGEGADPAALAAAAGVDLACVLRRLAALPAEAAPGPTGLAICDASGTLVFRKPVDGLTLPRFGAACPLLPLYQALARPMSPVRAVIEQAGRRRQRFLAYAVAQPAFAPDFAMPTVFEATMLVLPAEGPEPAPGPVIRVGTSCRVCPRRDCAARREPSILTESA